MQSVLVVVPHSLKNKSGPETSFNFQLHSSHFSASQLFSPSGLERERKRERKEEKIPRKGA
jgi:hypothetical protein